MRHSVVVESRQVVSINYSSDFVPWPATQHKRRFDARKVVVPGNQTTPPELLSDLYTGATNPSQWPRFLTGLAGLFGTGTATLRVVDQDAPVVHQSFTAGFDDGASRRYVEDLVSVDPFRGYLSSLPLGAIGVSHEAIEDRAYSASEHYHEVFRPNGNFYAMGAHVERSRARALQIGIHRPRGRNRFSDRERRTLSYFVPHLREAARLMRLVGRFEQALHQSRAALNRLPQGVWLLDGDLRCRWMNHAAEEAIQTGVYGLGLRGGRLLVNDANGAARLRAALTAVSRQQWPCRTVRIGSAGAALSVVADGQAGHALDGFGGDAGVLVFLLDPDRPVIPDPQRLADLYAFTPAECRLAAEFLQGFDPGEISVRLDVSAHTTRTHLKSLMQKTGASRQPELMRELLMVTATLRNDF